MMFCSRVQGEDKLRSSSNGGVGLRTVSNEADSGGCSGGRFIRSDPTRRAGSDFKYGCRSSGVSDWVQGGGVVADGAGSIHRTWLR
ncbi:hypothetical protein FF1_043450 [Malus domestica]